MALRIGAHAVQQLDPSNKKVLATYPYKDVESIYEVSDYPGGLIIQTKDFGRLHMFAAEARPEILQKICQNAGNFMGVFIDRPKTMTFDQFQANKFGAYRYAFSLIKDCTDAKKKKKMRLGKKLIFVQNFLKISKQILVKNLLDSPF